MAGAGLDERRPPGAQGLRSPESGSAREGARYAADLINSRIQHTAAPQPFAYKDKGSMATIAKFKAVALIGKVRLTGFLAWVAWLFLHLLYIAGFKQRVTTLLSWALTFLSNGRSQLVVTNQQMVGRLALEKLGTNVSGRLIEGDDVAPRE